MLPKLVYELLPFFYLACAASLYWFTDGAERILPSILFAICALMTFIWRWKNRKPELLSKSSNESA